MKGKHVSITGSTTQKLFRELDGKIRGDWVLVGGSLLPVLGIAHRATYDIDLVSVGEATQADTLALFSAAEKVGLPVEAVNTAATYFVHKILGFQKSLLPLFEGKQLRVMRPDLVLYWRLKLARLSETDLEDCLAYLDWSRPLSAEAARELEKAIKFAAKDGDSARKGRLERMAVALKRKA